MNGAAHRGRESMPISWNDLWNSFYNLAWMNVPFSENQEAVARDFMFLIGYTSEAARFWDVYGVYADAMTSYAAHYNGLPILQQYFENGWQDISNFGQDVTSFPSRPPLYINEQVGTLYNWGSVHRWLAMMLHNADDKYYTAGDWRFSEL